ncbi:hypothetical protein PCE1_004011 [Barthelona sp. PCE]
MYSWARRFEPHPIDVGEADNDFLVPLLTYLSQYCISDDIAAETSKIMIKVATDLLIGCAEDTIKHCPMIFSQIIASITSFAVLNAEKLLKGNVELINNMYKCFSLLKDRVEDITFFMIENSIKQLDSAFPTLSGEHMTVSAAATVRDIWTAPDEFDSVFNPVQLSTDYKVKDLIEYTSKLPMYDDFEFESMCSFVEQIDKNGIKDDERIERNLHPSMLYGDNQNVSLCRCVGTLSKPAAALRFLSLVRCNFKRSICPVLLGTLMDTCVRGMIPKLLYITTSLRPEFIPVLFEMVTNMPDCDELIHVAERLILMHHSPTYWNVALFLLETASDSAFFHVCAYLQGLTLKQLSYQQAKKIVAVVQRISAHVIEKGQNQSIISKASVLHDGLYSICTNLFRSQRSDIRKAVSGVMARLKQRRVRKIETVDNKSETLQFRCSSEMVESTKSSITLQLIITSAVEFVICNVISDPEIEYLTIKDILLDGKEIKVYAHFECRQLEPYNFKVSFNAMDANGCMHNFTLTNILVDYSDLIFMLKDDEHIDMSAVPTFETMIVLTVEEYTTFLERYIGDGTLPAQWRMRGIEVYMSCSVENNDTSVVLTFCTTSKELTRNLTRYVRLSVTQPT